jgi:type II secretory pathway component GspD/PulD (secretin)
MFDVNKYLRLLTVIGLAFVLACTSFAQEPIAVPVSGAANVSAANLRVGPKQLKDYGIKGLDSRVNLKAIDDWDVVQLVEFLAYRGGLRNIVIGNGVHGLKTKLKFDDVTVGDALEVVMSVNNLAYTVKNDIITIMNDAEYRQLYGTSFYDHKQVRIRELKYADPVRVAALLAPVKSTIGTVVSDQMTGTLILIDTPAKISEMDAIISSTDISTLTRQLPTETQSFVLQYGDVAAMQTEIAAILTQEAGSVHADQRTRTLIVKDLPHKMREIERVVAMFDRRSKQVFIESKIVQVRLNDDYRLGINWNHMFNGLDPRFSLKTVAAPTAIATLGASAKTPTGSMTFNTIAAGGDLSMVLDALKGVGETKILSNPHVAVIDGEEASIKVVTDQPYAEAQLESGTTNVVGESIQFIEVGVTLGVTPRINDQDLISMDIKPEVSSVVGSYQAFRSVPIVRKSLAETSVMIKNNETIIIAGMIDNQKEEVESRIPLLGRIPLIGLLFKSYREETQSNELIVFLTPRIITGEKPYLRLKDMKKSAKPLRTIGPSSSKKLKSLR